MKFVFSIFLFSFLSLSLFSEPVWKSVIAYNLPSDKNPVKYYKKAKEKNALEKLSLEQRIEILNSVWKDTTEMIWMSDVQRDEMVKEIIVSTPENNIPELFKLFGTDVKGFEARFNFLPFEQMSFILNYVQPTLQRRPIDSGVFKIPHELFENQLEKNIDAEGDNLFQSHFTDFCGKVAVVRLWIRYNPDDYKRFMNELYYNGKAKLNGMEFRTPPSVIDAVNKDEISPDPNQKVLFKNPEVNEKMPEMMDMVLYLTLASTFHTFPYNNVEYKPGKHLENSAWAGAAINPEVTFLKTMGFQVEKVGDNFRGVSDLQFQILKSASTRDSKKKVMLLVNSSMLDTLSGACKEYDCPREIEHKDFGTHWITINYTDESTDIISIWEYGRTRTFRGLKEMKKIIAGGIIIDGYQPK